MNTPPNLNTRLASLRGLLNAQPSADVWLSVCSVIDDAPDHEQSLVLEYAQQHLQSWPAALRVAPEPWCVALTVGRIAPSMCVVRSLSLSDWPPVGAFSEAALALVAQFHTSGHEQRGAAPGRDTWEASSFAKLLMLISASPHLTGLERLDVSDNRLWLRAVDMAAVANVIQNTNVRHLNLSGNAVGARHLRILDRALAATDPAHRLTSLNLADNRLGHDAIAFLCSSQIIADLEYLNLAGASPGREGFRALAHAPLGALRALDLSRTSMGQADLDLLVSSPLVRGLTTLSLRDNSLPGDAEAFVRAHCARLGVLEI